MNDISSYGKMVLNSIQSTDIRCNRFVFGPGSLFINSSGKLEFEGDLEESAKIFLAYICQELNKR